MHLALLSQSGPGDAFHSAAFQAGLEHSTYRAMAESGPRAVLYGSHVKLRLADGPRCWLHSTAATYPTVYPDARVSSSRQIVSCSMSDDPDAWFAIMPAADVSPDGADGDGDAGGDGKGDTAAALLAARAAVEPVPVRMYVAAGRGVVAWDRVWRGRWRLCGYRYSD